MRINILFVETSVCSKIEFLITLHSTLEIYIKCSILPRREIHGISQEVTGVIIGPGLNQPKNYLYIIMEEFRRRIFLLIYGNPSKSEAFYPKIKILWDKKSIFKKSSRGGLKNQNGHRFSAVTSFLSIILKSRHLGKKVGRTFFKEYKLGYNYNPQPTIYLNPTFTWT